MGIYSDMKYADVFRDPKWLLDNLFEKYKVIRIPTAGGWSPDNAGSGSYGYRAQYIEAYTGTTANSRGHAWHFNFGLASGDIFTRTNFNKRLEIRFMLCRRYSDPECVARVHLMAGTYWGDLVSLGLGLRIDNYSVTGEAYGTARGTVALTTLTDSVPKSFRIVHIPGVRVEFYVDDVLAGTLTGTAVPSGTTGDSCFRVGIANGATGGVNVALEVGNIIVIQEK